ncbi:MAG: alginate export family protein [Gemmataceae bacterium]
MPPFFPTGPGYYSLWDQLNGDCKEKAPKTPWGIYSFTQASSFDLDFRYLDKPDNKQHDIFDPLKRIHIGDDWLLSMGGQTWLRTMNEVDARLTKTNDSYQLLRNREYVDLWYQDRFRLFGEFIYAESFNNNLDPRAIDINRADFLNLFGEMKVYGSSDGSAYLRVGRQELLYGSQRLISTLDWANTRRTFQGIKGYYTSKEWDFDLFWVQPVAINRDHLDSVDNNKNFFGAWATRKLEDGQSLDFYYLYLDDTNPTAVGVGGVKGGQFVHTLGTRYFGKYDNWRIDFEPMLQLGSASNQNKVAASIPIGVGYEAAEKSWKPQAWVYYDWASGDSNPGQGNNNSTFNQLFPFGHYYYGYLDLVGRQNIHDVYGQVAFFPENWLTCLIQYHNFWLANERDALYNAAGAPTRRDPTGNAGRYVGNEIDLFMSAQLTTHTNFGIGYSKLFSGGFIAKTGPDVSPELFYMQVNYRW